MVSFDIFSYGRSGGLPPAESPTPTPANTARNSIDLSGCGKLETICEPPDEFEEVATFRRGDAAAVESSIAKWIYLFLYFALNLGLTIYNKAVMDTFPQPYMLTALHAAFGCLGCTFLNRRGYYAMRHLSREETVVLVFFSMLYTLNISISNVSLNLVTIPFHQVVRATSPIFTVLIYALCYHKTYSLSTYVSLAPVIAGVGFATYGDYYCTALGFFSTLLGSFLAALKTVITNRLQTGPLQLSAFEILHLMSPLALSQSLAYAYLSGEFAAFGRLAFVEGRLNITMLNVLLVNGLMAFALNVTSFTANKKAGALTMTVAANIKQVLTIVLSIVFFQLDGLKA
ncbi:MAG: UAA transporter [Thelocarpon impressellum]|nr:MAG: UAA transporter [Thelocarpon impressellum]